MDIEFLNQLIAIKATIILGWFALLFISERLLPKSTMPAQFDIHISRWQRVGRNITLFMLNGIIGRIFVIPLTLWATQYGLNWRDGYISDPILSIILDIIILDMMIYWWHRLNHRVPFLWRFHQIHHYDNFLDSTSAVRFHFAEVMLSAIFRMAVIIMMGIPFTSVIIHETILMLCALFQHSNIRLNDKIDRILSFVIVTPNWHWLHHHAVRHDTDSNYANAITLWDYIFKSTSVNKKALQQRKLDMKIGIEGMGNDKSLKKLLLLPFKR